MSMTMDKAIHVGAELLLPSIKIGPRSEPNVVVDSSDEAILGIDILSRFKITLDLRDKRMYLESGDNYSAGARLVGSIGAAVATSGGKATVTYVFDDLPGFVPVKQGRSLRKRNSYAVGITPDQDQV